MNTPTHLAKIGLNEVHYDMCSENLHDTKRKGYNFIGYGTISRINGVDQDFVTVHAFFTRHFSLRKTVNKFLTDHAAHMIFNATNSDGGTIVCMTDQEVLRVAFSADETGWTSEVTGIFYPI